MNNHIPVQYPKVSVPLDPEFQPIILFVQAFEQAVSLSNHTTRVKLAIKRSDNQIAALDTKVFDHEGLLEDNYQYI